VNLRKEKTIYAKNPKEKREYIYIYSLLAKVVACDELSFAAKPEKLCL
jgi:hypothetical protein